MNAVGTPPVVNMDAMNTLADLIGVISNPTASKKMLKELQDKINEAHAARDEAAAREAKATAAEEAAAASKVKMAGDLADIAARTSAQDLREGQLLVKARAVQEREDNVKAREATIVAAQRVQAAAIERFEAECVAKQAALDKTIANMELLRDKAANAKELYERKLAAMQAAIGV